MNATTNEVTGVAPDQTFTCPGAAEMAAFDSLPRALRDALNYAPGPVSAAQCAQEVAVGMPPALVVTLVREAGNTHYGVPDDGLGARRLKRSRR